VSSFLYLQKKAEMYSRAPSDVGLYSAEPKTISLTFDDGPHPEYTPELVRLLAQEQVPATFFLVGEQVLRYPHIARTLVEQGHEIGNHSLTHEHSVHASIEHIRQELTSTDHALVSATGHSSVLYRPPFLLDINYGIVDGRLIDSGALRTIESMGLLVVGADIDTTDWEKESVHNAEEIYSILVSGVERGGHVVLMHDHGGEGATIEALRRFIPEMKERGYTFVPVSHYFNLSQEIVMPRVSQTIWHTIISKLLFARTIGDTVLYMFAAVIGILGLMRMWLIFASFRFFSARALVESDEEEPRSTIPFSVIIPAFNEEANIAATLRSINGSTLKPESIIVVDDGSTDRTASIVRTLSGIVSPPLLLLQKQNGGSKAGALRYGLAHTQEPIAVCIDADTVIDTHAFAHLLQHFSDQEVGAVAGKMYPASTKTILDKLQYIEYVQGQNLDKKVLALGSSVGIVPGAIGAWRKSAIETCGGYSTDTVVEDQDLTLALLTRGWKVEFEPRAIAFTETPATVRNFFTQRFRWMFGTLQCFYKYDSWIFSTSRPWLGFIILPNTILFSIILPLTTPFLDAFAIAGILGLVHVPVIVMVFCLLLTLDIWFAFEGLRQEKNPRYMWLALIPLQRLFYQYIAVMTVSKSIVTALSGSMVRWGQLARRGSAAEIMSHTPETVSPSLVTSSVLTSLNSR
jgi:cellulose synthase/poly-beta-1,6-N-acetylglucosamine synthase-like glycosyltransferase/peptidoglycan/xylan/chitin deacetylase (PgdA/CDA1 family)